MSGLDSGEVKLIAGTCVAIVCTVMINKPSDHIQAEYD
jgi:hypothetical protein